MGNTSSWVPVLWITAKIPDYISVTITWTRNLDSLSTSLKISGSNLEESCEIPDRYWELDQFDEADRLANAAVNRFIRKWWGFKDVK